MDHSHPQHRRAALAIGLALMAFLLAGCANGATVASSWPGLSSNGGSAYICYGPAVYAVDLASGTERWRFPPRPTAVSPSTPPQPSPPTAT